MDARNPRALALCDGCGFLVQHDTLQKEMQYRGGLSPVWTGFLVCGRCLDVPNAFGRLQVLPPDPVPVKDPRPDDGPNGGGTDSFPTYASGSLPNAAAFQPGYEIDVTGLDVGVRVRCVADGIYWRRNDNLKVVT